MEENSQTARNLEQVKEQDDSREQKGVTLVEIGLVVAIIALILIGTLLALSSVTNQSRLTQASGDMANFRSAIAKWSAGGPLFILQPATTVPTTGGGTTTIPSMNLGLSNWSQLTGFLPENIQLLASSTTGDTLTGANPWAGDYKLVTTSASPRVYTLELTNVPENAANAFKQQLDTIGGAAVTITGTGTVVLSAVYQN